MFTFVFIPISIIVFLLLTVDLKNKNENGKTLNEMDSNIVDKQSELKILNATLDV